MQSNKETIIKILTENQHNSLKRIEEGDEPDDVLTQNALIMAHFVITQGGKLNIDQSNVNLEAFTSLIKETINYSVAKTHKPARLLM